MNIGRLFTYISLGSLAAWVVLFIVGELVMLQLRRMGWTNARTLSQYTRKRAEEGEPFYRVLLFVLPIFLTVCGIWLFFHLAGPCIEWGLFCEIDI